MFITNMQVKQIIHAYRLLIAAQIGWLIGSSIRNAINFYTQSPDDVQTSMDVLLTNLYDFGYFSVGLTIGHFIGDIVGSMRYGIPSVPYSPLWIFERITGKPDNYYYYRDYYYHHPDEQSDEQTNDEQSDEQSNDEQANSLSNDEKYIIISDKKED